MAEAVAAAAAATEVLPVSRGNGATPKGRNHLDGGKLSKVIGVRAALLGQGPPGPAGAALPLWFALPQAGCCPPPHGYFLLPPTGASWSLFLSSYSGHIPAAPPSHGKAASRCLTPPNPASALAPGGVSRCVIPNLS